MPHLAEHIADLESLIAVMTHDGHHTDAQVRAALERMDCAAQMLAAAKRRQIVEGTATPEPPRKKPRPIKRKPRDAN